MAILSMGTAVTDDVEAGLHLTDRGSAYAGWCHDHPLVKAAESHVKLETGRNFKRESSSTRLMTLRRTRRKFSYRSSGRFDRLDRPGKDEPHDGSVTTRVIPAGEYVVNKATGIVSKLSGSILGRRRFSSAGLPAIPRRKSAAVRRLRSRF